MEWVFVAAGVAIMAVAIFDIFKTLLDPQDQGRVTDQISWMVWRVCKLTPRWIMSYAGPLAYISVLSTWALLLITGGALVYWPFMPEAFAYDSGLDPEHRTGFMTAFYLSFVSFATLGYGDITPAETWLRLVGPLQTLIGFFLLSAAITWILAIYQDIETRRTLAHETTLLKQALEEGGHQLSDLQPRSLEKILDEVTTRFVRVSGSLNQFPITYFFRITDDRQSLAVMAMFLSDLSEELSHEDLPTEVRLQARMLAGALNHFAEALQGRFVDVPTGSTTREVLEAYAADHERATTRAKV